MKALATSVILFLSLFFATFASGQAVAPTLGRNNVWTGSNTFNGGLHVPALQQCESTQYMAGYNTNFTPICLNFSGTTGAVTTLNGLQNTVAITNTDSNLGISIVGQNIQINCPGCGGSSGTPGGTNGSIQYNNSGSFGGIVVTGLVKGNGTGAPSAAIPGTDFALPFVITCNTGITCPQVGQTYTFSLTGSAGTGDVAQGNFGQIGGYSNSGGSTTIGGAPNLYSVNGSWTLAQMNALFTRFNASPITAWSASGATVTITANNSWSVGDTVVLGGLVSGSCLNGQFYTVSSTGLSQTQWEANNPGSCSGSDTEAGYQTANEPAVGLNTLALVFVPPYMRDNPSNAWTNTAAQTLDWRKGYAWQQTSQYGIKCDAGGLAVTLTAGSNQVEVGSSLSASNVGMTLVAAQQVGYGDNGLQEDWEPTITGYTYPYATLSSNAPFNATDLRVVIGTNNQVALTRAFNDVGQAIPLNIPTSCNILTDTVRWPGTSLIGQQMQNSGFIGFPGHDILQQQDGTPITAWSINTGTGLTTFTIPAYASHNIIADNGNGGQLGDTVVLKNFATSTFFNNTTIQIYTQPTPTTFTVKSVFGQSTSSSSEAGLAAPTTAANTNGLRIENVNFIVNNAINPSFPWNHYDGQTDDETVEPAMYRPLAQFNYPANNPLAPGWGTGAVNGVSETTANSAVICTSNTITPFSVYPNIPAVGTTIVFPYQGVGQFVTTVASTAGSCSSGFTARTLTAALPNNAAFTGTQTEWFTTTTPQTLSVAIPDAITYPYTVTLNLPVAFIPGWESNVAPHGRIQIGPDQFDYMGIGLGYTNGTSTLTLVDGPTSPNSGTGDVIGSVVFPLNPCQAMYNNSYPAIPSQSATVATPAYSTYYPSQCGGNAAIALPNADAIAFTPESSGLSVAFFNNVAANNFTANALGNTDNNGSMFMYQAGNNTGYGNTFNAIRVNGLAFGFAQGPSSVNEHGVRVVGPTSTGQTIRDCTFRTGFPIILVGMEQSRIERCDTYSTEVSPYDGTQVGAATGLYLSYTLSEIDGKGVTGLSQFSVYDYNSEPENGNHEEILPSVVSDAPNVSWNGNIFEGGVNIFGGAYQIIHGTQIAVPVFNYGSNNYFEDMSQFNTGANDANVYNGGLYFYNWGQNSDCSASPITGGPKRMCSPGMVQDYNGHDVWASMMGNNVIPTENILGGMFTMGDWQAEGTTPVFDSTELWWGQHIECNIGSALECVNNFNNELYIGSHQRIAPAPAVLKANVKLKNSGTATFRILLTAQNPGSGCTPNTNLASATFTVTSSGWTPVQMPVDFTGTQGCTFEPVFDEGSASNVLEVGYFNIVPFPGQMYIPLGTPTEGDDCPVAGEFQVDTSYMYICKPLSGHAFGSGIWARAPIT